MKDWNINIYRGILTGYNEAFIIDGKTKEQLIEKSPKNAEIIRPILRGRDIKRYGYEFADLWLICTHNGTPTTPPINIEDFPDIKAYLDKYYTQLSERQDKGRTLYNLRSCIYMDDFSKQKIIFQEMVQEPSFMYDKDGKFYCLDTGRIITGNDIEYIITILNSNLFFFAVKNFYGGGGLGANGVRMKHTFFENFSCPIPNSEQKHFLISLLNKTVNNIDNKHIEIEMNKEIYSMYGLTNEEICFIEAQ